MIVYSEDEVLSGVKAGDEKIIRIFYSQHFPKVQNYVLNNSGTKTEAEDVFQDAMVLTYQKLKVGALNLDCSLATYVFAVSRNLWRNVLRKNSKVVLQDKLPDITQTLESEIVEEIHSQEKNMIYQKYFLKLGNKCQILLQLFFSGKSMAEISGLMGYSIGYARKKKFECKENLIEMLEKDPTFVELKYESQK